MKVKTTMIEPTKNLEKCIPLAGAKFADLLSSLIKLIPICTGEDKLKSQIQLLEQEAKQSGILQCAEWRQFCGVAEAGGLLKKYPWR